MKIIKRINIDKYIENMSILYLPFKINQQFHIPKNLKCFEPLIFTAFEDLLTTTTKKYGYITANRDLVKKGSYQKREGWHIDGFKSDDVNYIWTDGESTEYLEGDYNVDPDSYDHGNALMLCELLASYHSEKIKRIENNVIVRLDNTIHRTPKILSDHVRTFVKISFSDEQYNLKGNAINYDLNYKWKYYDREMVRNHPVCSNSDSFEG